MKPARNPYDFDEAVQRAGLPTWPKTADGPLREQVYLTWLMVSPLRTRVGVGAAALLAGADGQYETLDAAYRLGGDAAVLGLLEPYLEKLHGS